MKMTGKAFIAIAAAFGTVCALLVAIACSILFWLEIAWKAALIGYVACASFIDLFLVGYAWRMCLSNKKMFND